MKRIIIAYNPVSGRGRATQLATAIASCFVRHPNDVELVPTKQEDPKDWLIPKLKTKPDAVVVVGGDGTLRQVASVLVGTNIPIYHAASGTENLFAKSMNMSSEPEEIAKGKEVCARHNIKFIPNQDRGLQWAAKTMLDNIDDDVEFIVWCTHDTVPMNQNFFKGLSASKIGQFLKNLI